MLVLCKCISLAIQIHRVLGFLQTQIRLVIQFPISIFTHFHAISIFLYIQELNFDSFCARATCGK